LVRRIGGERARPRRFRARRRFSLARVPRLAMETLLDIAEERRFRWQ